MFLPVFHLTVFFIYSYTLWYDQNYVEFPLPTEISKHNLPFKSRILFLTMWSLLLQTIYFGIAFLNDIFGSNAKKHTKLPLIRVFKDSLFSLALPIALYVVLAFWSIYAIDRDLIWPERIEKVIPLWANHVMHTFIAPFLLIELLVSHRKPPSKAVGVAQAMAFTFSYLVTLNLAYQKTGHWAYPFLKEMDWRVRIVFFIFSIFSIVFMYSFGEKIDSLVNGNRNLSKSKNR